MPPRTITLAIVALWLTAVGWAGYRAWGSATAPPPLLDRTDEVGLQSYRWLVLVGDKKVGHVQAAIGRPKQGPRFALHASFTFVEEFRFRGLEIKTLKSTYRATPRGQFRELHCEVAIGERTAQVWGKLYDGYFWATVSRDIPRACEQIRGVDGLEEALNVLHPLHRIPGLRAGREWSVLALDPLELALDKDGENRESAFCGLEAMTAADRLRWDEKDVPCWRVDFRRAGQVRARVWARRDDGLVLQQEAYVGDTLIVMEREPDRGPRRRLPGLGE